MIVGDPKIPPDQVGVPFRIALSLFKPFIIHKSTTKYASKWAALGYDKPSILSIGHLIDMVKEGKKNLLSKEILSLFLTILEEICEEKVVILKRDPALHRLGLRAFHPTIVFTDSFHINPLLTDGFGADFDGDQMAIYLPLTEAAQKEAKEKMSVNKNIWGPSGAELTLNFKNDTAHGVYCMTEDPKGKQTNLTPKSLDELKDILIKNSDPTILVRYKGKNITVGRAIVEEITGVSITKQLKKKDTNNLFFDLATKEPPEVIMQKMNTLMQISLIVPTLIGKSINIDQFELPANLQKKKEKALVAENPSEAIAEVTNDVIQALKNSESLVFDLYDSGARGSKTNIQTQIVAKGYVEDVDGEAIDKPIASSLNDGLTPTEYIQASVGGRKGIVDRSQMTAVSGYLTRQLVYCNASVKMGTKKDCGTKRYFEIPEVTEDIAKVLLHRYLANGTLIKNPKDLIGKRILLRSPMYCTSPEMCQMCVGFDAATKIRAENIGIIAAQILGERGTQLTMRVFHTGASANIKSFLTEESRLSSIFTQDGNDITTKKKVRFIFDKEDIRGIEGNEYIIQIFSIETEDEKIDLVLSYNFTLIVPSDDYLTTDGETHIVTFDENMLCGSMKNSSQGITGAIVEIAKIFNSRALVNDTLALKIHELYSTSAFVPLWAIELVCSQTARSRKTPQIPYRLSGMRDEPLRVPMKQVALLENWKRGAAFENVSNALHTAILNGSDNTRRASDLDSLLDL